MAFQPAFNARLINEVRKYPCLYNHSRRGSGDTMERQRLWESIAKNIDQNCAAEFAKKRWLQLRDRYRKELKIAIKNGFVTPVRWCYFNQLSWLDPYLKDNIGQVADEGKKTNNSFDETTPFNWFGLTNLTTIKDEMDDEDGDPALESSVLDRLLAQTAQRLDSVSPEMENDESGTQSLDGERIDVDDSDIPPTSDMDTNPTPEQIEAKDENDCDDNKQSIQLLPNTLSNAIEALSQNTKPTVESLIAANQARFAHHLAAQLSGMSHAMMNGSKKSESAATPQQIFNESQSPTIAPSPTPNGTTTTPTFGQQTTSQTTTGFHPYKDHIRNNRHNRQHAENMMRHHLQTVGRVALEWLNDEDLLYSRIIGLKLKKMDPKKRKKVRDQIMTLLEESDDGDHDDSCSSHSPRDDNDDNVEHIDNDISVNTSQ